MDDEIDFILAGFINQKLDMDGLSVMFLRMSEGVYQFGTKLCYISTDLSGSLKVKVGGSFMDIEDFLAQYSGIEAAKYQKKSGLTDRLKRKFMRMRSKRSGSNYGMSPARSNSSMMRSSIRI